jgi:hypothetical protein
MRTPRTVSVHRAARIAGAHAVTLARLAVDHPPLGAELAQTTHEDDRVRLSVLVTALGY